MTRAQAQAVDTDELDARIPLEKTEIAHLPWATLRSAPDLRLEAVATRLCNEAPANNATRSASVVALHPQADAVRAEVGVSGANGSG